MTIGAITIIRVPQAINSFPKYTGANTFPTAIIPNAIPQAIKSIKRMDTHIYLLEISSSPLATKFVILGSITTPSAAITP